MAGRENANILDLKMGVSTVTCNIRGNPKRMSKRLAKDQQTTTSTLGMRVIGYVIKSLERRVAEKFYKFPYKSEAEIMVTLHKLFSYPRSES